MLGIHGSSQITHVVREHRVEALEFVHLPDPGKHPVFHGAPDLAPQFAVKSLPEIIRGNGHIEAHCHLRCFRRE